MDEKECMEIEKKQRSWMIMLLREIAFAAEIMMRLPERYRGVKA